MESEDDSEAAIRLLCLETDRLHRSINTLRTAVMQLQQDNAAQHALNTQQKAEIDELYRWAGETAKHHGRAVEIGREVMHFLNDQHKQTESQLESDRALFSKQLAYLEGVVSRLYGRLFPDADCTQRDGGAASEIPNLLPDQKRTDH